MTLLYVHVYLCIANFNIYNNIIALSSIITALTHMYASALGLVSVDDLPTCTCDSIQGLMSVYEFIHANVQFLRCRISLEYLQDLSLYSGTKIRAFTSLLN